MIYTSGMHIAFNFKELYAVKLQYNYDEQRPRTVHDPHRLETTVSTGANRPFLQSTRHVREKITPAVGLVELARPKSHPPNTLALQATNTAGVPPPSSCSAW